MRSLDESNRGWRCGGRRVALAAGTMTAVRCFIACYQNDLARAETYAGRGAPKDCRERISPIGASHLSMAAPGIPTAATGAGRKREAAP